jgi:hypothetical protein
MQKLFRRSNITSHISLVIFLNYGNTKDIEFVRQTIGHRSLNIQVT